MTHRLSKDVIRDAVPKHLRSMITDEVVDTVNSLNEDKETLGVYTENFLSYIGVIKEGKYKFNDYISAVRFVSLKLLGKTDIDAYMITFPERYQRLIDEGYQRTEISAYASAYKKNKLPSRIFEQTIVPTHVLNAPMHQKALNIALEIATNSRSDIARVNACNTILSNTKPPEAAKLEIDMKVSTDNVIDDYEKAMRAFVSKQKELMEQGHDIKTIANASIKPPEEEEAMEAEVV